MRANLDRLGGLIHSQRVLLALTEAGVSREEAYRIVQRNAMKVWDEGGDFPRRAARRQGGDARAVREDAARPVRPRLSPQARGHDLQARVRQRRDQKEAQPLTGHQRRQGPGQTARRSGKAGLPTLTEKLRSTQSLRISLLKRYQPIGGGLAKRAAFLAKAGSATRARPAAAITLARIPTGGSRGQPA